MQIPISYYYSNLKVCKITDFYANIKIFLIRFGIFDLFFILLHKITTEHIILLIITNMTKRSFFLAVAMIFAATIFAQDAFLGDWITVDDASGEHKSIVNIHQDENGKYYGTITQLLDPKEADALCVECTGEEHNQPIVGLTIIRDMQWKDGELRGGKVLDPDNGKFYYAKMYLKDGKLVLRGSLDKAGMLGRSQTWLRK
jgi:uncharacterized protein (DUF2147 family)